MRALECLHRFLSNGTEVAGDGGIRVVAFGLEELLKCSDFVSFATKKE